MHSIWKVNQEDLEKYRNVLKIRKRLIMEQGRGKAMFKEELDELEDMYAEGIKAGNESVADLLPTLLRYMEKFVCMHKGIDDLKEKLELLRHKMGKSEEENEDE